jgi:HK97 family phage major capsid protein/HK97 family phage prohead protease
MKTTGNTQPKTVPAGNLTRQFLLTREAVNVEQRTVDLAFSSEIVVDRWWGKEILDHSPGSVRLGRMQNRAAVLDNHDRDNQVGVVEQARIDQDRRGRATVRFSRNAKADEVFQDVVDGIRAHVSVGYRVYKAVLESTDDSGDTYRIMDWEPYEVSIVSVPADNSVGIGRAADFDIRSFLPLESNMFENEEQHLAAEQRSAPTGAPLNTAIIEDAARAAERNRINTIQRTAEVYADKIDGVADLARQFIDNGRSVAEFNAAALEKMGRSTPAVQNAPAVDFTEREHRDYSVLRACRALLDNDWGSAGFEREVSNEIARKLGRQASGFFMPTNLRMPDNMGQRAVNVAGTDNVGGFTVATELQSVIDLLRARMMTRALGARVLTGLQGDIAFPRITGGAALSWVGENPGSEVGESNLAFDQVVLTPKTAQASIPVSRQLLVQSSFDVEMMIRSDLATVGALGLDLAAINGSGSSNQPTGILNTSGIGAVAGGTNGLAPTWAHIVDLETQVAIDNADLGSLAYLTNSKVRGKLKTTEKASSTAQFVWENGELNGYRAEASNQVPGNLTKGTATGVCSAIIFGNWNDLIIGEWGAMEIIVDPYSLKKKGLVELTSIMMADVAVRHPESFASMKDALTS